MKLKKADGTWPFILTHNVAAIVPDEIYPADAKQPDDKAIGSGPYKLEKYTPEPAGRVRGQPELHRPEQGADAELHRPVLRAGLGAEAGDRAGRGRRRLPQPLPDRPRGAQERGDKGVKVVDGAGTEIRYIVFNVKKKPVDDVAVRKAVAQVIDRDAIATNVYKDTVKPLYSTVPAALPGAKESFKDAFGDPDPAKAKAILEEAGVTTPVELDGWYTPTHYGPVEVDLWNEIKRQLEASGLFKVNLDSTEWDQYKEEAFDEGHVLLLRPRLVPGLSRTPTTTSAPFMRDGGFFVNGYSNKDVNDAARHGARVRRRG